MKTISLVAFRRPDYTRQTLESLRAQPTIGEYKLFIAIEPGHPETIAVCRKVDFMECSISINPRILGITRNNLELYERVFNAGSTFDVALEDDTPLAPDALRLAEWFLGLESRDRYWLLNLFSGSRSPDHPLLVHEHDAFCPWAYCLTPFGFERIRSHWMCDERGWDWSICAALLKTGNKVLKPYLSRSRNIGRTDGSFCTPEYHDHCFGGHVASDGMARGEFQLG